MAKNPVYVLMVEDDKEFADNFIRQSSEHNIKVTHVTNLQDMMETLKKIHRNIATVVLDVKCLKTPDQEIDNPDFIGAAISALDRNYPEVPRAIFTADSTSYDFLEEIMRHEKRFRKTPEGLTSLFSLIKENALNLKFLKIREKHKQVFKIFDDKMLGSHIDNQLIGLLDNMESDNTDVILNNLATIRRIQESVFQAINKSHKSIIPDYLLKDNRDVPFHVINKHLSGNKTRENDYKPTSEVFYDGVVESFSQMIYSVSSDNGAHNPYENPMYSPTKYTVQACVYSLLDFLLWFKDVMDRHGGDKVE
ncbi:MAG TPA: hypothetical protein VLJ60_10105 [bacterium]|nr:hypothetical protein [bacterium]